MPVLEQLGQGLGALLPNAACMYNITFPPKNAKSPIPMRPVVAEVEEGDGAVASMEGIAELACALIAQVVALDVQLLHAQVALQRIGQHTAAQRAQVVVAASMHLSSIRFSWLTCFKKARLMARVVIEEFSATASASALQPS